MNEIIIVGTVSECRGNLGFEIWKHLRVSVEYRDPAATWGAIDFWVPNTAHAKARWMVGTKATITITPNMPAFPDAEQQKP